MNELQTLRDRVQELEELLGYSVRDVGLAGLPLPPLARSMLGVLYKSHIASREHLFTALYGMRPEADQPEITIIDVQLCKLRKQLAKQGIAITLSRTAGWYLKPDDKEKVRLWIESLQ